MALRTVLVVEDSEIEGQMLERGLLAAIARSSVVIAHTTTEAERYLFSDSAIAGGARATPDLLFVDVKVPPAGGVEFLRRVRADARTRAIPIVMLSGQMMDEDVQYLYRLGANSYLDKPIDFQDFVNLIAAAARYWLSLNLNVKQGR